MTEFLKRTNHLAHMSAITGLVFNVQMRMWAVIENLHVLTNCFSTLHQEIGVCLVPN